MDGNQIIPQPFPLMKMGGQRYAFLDKSRVIKDLDFRGGRWVLWDMILLCVTFPFGAMQLGTPIKFLKTICQAFNL